MPSDQGHSVVVAAPTGSGKTLLWGVITAIHGPGPTARRCFYTTPLKAPSKTQKLRDSPRKQFGAEVKVGLHDG